MAILKTLFHNLPHRRCPCEVHSTQPSLPVHDLIRSEGWKFFIMSHIV